MDIDFTQWTAATADLEWGVQHAFHDVLTLAKDGKTTLVFGADYFDKGACLVNQAANLLITGGGFGVPIATFGRVVSLFDRINGELHIRGVNPTLNYVSPLAAEILLTHFGPLKDRPAPGTPQPKHSDEFNEFTFIEPTDEEFASELERMFTTEAPTEENKTCPHGLHFNGFYCEECTDVSTSERTPEDDYGYAAKHRPESE